MKALFNKLLFLLIPVLFTTQCEKESWEVNIPDEAFLEALIKVGVDKDGNGTISNKEAEEAKFLNVSMFEIEDMTGIEAFVNLDTLFCSFNLLKNLDISNNTSLVFLNCSYNSLTTLDVSNNTALEGLSCWSNQLTTLAVSDNTALKYLDCSSNQIINLDVSNNPALEYLSCYSNRLTTMDVSKFTSLEVLWCESNQLTTMDVSNNTALWYLNCAGNLITSLDVSDQQDLFILYCNNNKLTFLDISNNYFLGDVLHADNDVVSKYAVIYKICGDVDPDDYLTWEHICVLDISGMPTLQKVCVWEVPFPPNGFNLYAEDSPNVNFTTDCN